jgi:Phage terminase large subunit (GpA)
LIQLKHDAWCVACAVFAEAPRPPLPVRPSEFGRDLIVPDGPRKLGKWDPTLTPYIIEPLDMTSTDSTANSFCVMKSAQTGFTTLLLAAIAHTICYDKADTMIVQQQKAAALSRGDEGDGAARRQADLAIWERVHDLREKVRPLHLDLGAGVVLGRPAVQNNSESISRRMR